MMRRSQVVGWIAVVWMLGMVLGASAQTVRHESGYGSGSVRRKFDKAAEKAGRQDWLQAPYDGPGTQVRITFDARNADLTLMTRHAFGLNHLLEEARKIIQRFNLPQTDYIVWEGTNS